MRIIDLRSDTVTLPTKEMLLSILDAELGDDVAGEDPTVNRLEQLAAERFGTEAALLTPTGTQSNLIAVMTHCHRGDEMLVESEAHIYYYEVGGMSAIAGVIPRLIRGKYGVFTGEDVQAALRGNDLHFPPSTLVEIENTHNRAGGTVWRPDEVRGVARVAHDFGMKVHIDGARIFNAAIALGVDVREYARHVDSISFCLSKGLCAPVGSVLVGNKEFIEKARKVRKMLGGGMRQAGVIAAPGIIALTKMVDRLKEDHDNAKKLARGLNQIGSLKVDMKRVQTNIVLLDVSSLNMRSTEFVLKAREKGLLVTDFGGTTVRFVTHYGITEEDIDVAIGIVESIC
ncbi:MAG: low-specificity L-threonine aldolase [Methanomassiliicoccales archaeon]|jgi:threonine aldolase|nr:low-specificity L-threonine aldolase [Methanomassiliicoccales archaeon]